MRRLVETYVDEAIDNLEAPNDLKDFLKRHGRKQELINNLTAQFLHAEKTKHKVKLTKEKIRESIIDFVGVFMKFAKTEADAANRKSNISLMEQFAKNFGKKEDEIKDSDFNVKVTSL